MTRTSIGASSIKIKPSRKYYIVVEKEDGKWSMQFGDYERAVAQDEMNELKYAAERGHKANFRCIQLESDTDAAIHAKLNELNAES